MRKCTKVFLGLTGAFALGAVAYAVLCKKGKDSVETVDDDELWYGCDCCGLDDYGEYERSLEKEGEPIPSKNTDKADVEEDAVDVVTADGTENVVPFSDPFSET